MHLPYGLPTEAIEEFSQYKEAKAVHPVLFQNVHTGTIKVKIQLHTTVPTRVRICGHAGLVYHQGQTRTCYNCNKDGHEAKQCPKQQQPPKKTKKSEGPRTTISTVKAMENVPTSATPSTSASTEDDPPEPPTKKTILEEPSQVETSNALAMAPTATTTEMVVDLPTDPPALSGPTAIDHPDTPVVHSQGPTVIPETPAPVDNSQMEVVSPDYRTNC